MIRRARTGLKNPAVASLSVCSRVLGIVFSWLGVAGDGTFGADHENGDLRVS
jgi:hypothetical protein